MTFEIIWSDSAVRQLKKLDRTVARRIFERVGELHDNPGRMVNKLANSPYYRLRVGKFRVILDIDENILRVIILKVGHRKTIYGK
jgi:mRNA interferase RelE/StbE